jgi:ABC-type sugar transport system permease subunit
LEVTRISQLVKSAKSRIGSKGGLAFILALPTFVIIFVVLIYPLLYSLYLSLFSWNLTRPDQIEFLGIGNYISILSSKSFWHAMKRTAYFVGVTVCMEVALGLLIALVLNQKFVGRGLVRGLVILPWALPTIVNGVMWRWIYNARYGALNSLLFQLGIIDSYKIWLKDPFIALNLVMVANIWKETPVAVLMVLAALQTFPKELYEAGSVDGASSFGRFRHITLPLLRPVLLILLVIKTIWAVKEFDIIYMITRGGPSEGTTIITYFIYLQTFKFLEFGYGAALGYVVTLIVMVLALIYVRKMASEGLT